jgi:TrmH family RNA methyltransferase
VNKFIEISSRDNKLVKFVHSLEKKSNRWDKKSFVIEGEKLLIEAIKTNQKIEFIMLSEKVFSSDRFNEIIETVEDNVNFYILEHKLFQSISNLENSQGILAVVSFNVKELKDISIRNIIFYSDGIQDPGNLGTIIRSIDAFGLGGIIIGENTVDPYNPKVVRATMGSIFRVPIFLNRNGINGLSYLQEKGFRILSTVPKEGIHINEFDFKTGDCIVIGNEGNGVSEEIKLLASDHLMINMKGNAESLNASIAAAIIMYEISTKV